MKSETKQTYAPYGWIISEDMIPVYSPHIIGGERSERGTTGPANIDPAIEKHIQDKLEGKENRNANYGLKTPIAKFRMSDADGEIYYVGYIAGEYEGSEPLDDFGTPNAGAIYIQYLDKNGQWSSTIEAN